MEGKRGDSLIKTINKKEGEEAKEDKKWKKLWRLKRKIKQG